MTKTGGTGKNLKSGKGSISVNKNVILLIEDEEKLSRTLAEYLELNGYRVLRALNGLEGLSMFYDHMHEVDLILLDIMLPGMDGSEILKEVRKKSNTPVIMVTARDSIHDQLLNFANGADDYITKPYALAIVKVHIEAILKRAGKQKERVEVGHIAVEPDTWRVYVDEKAIETTPKEYELLSYLIKNKNVVMTRDSILESVWGYDYSGDTRTVDTLVKQLRRKMAPYGSYIRSVYGVGYIFEGEENETAEA